MKDTEIDRRRFLKYGGAASGVLGLTSLSGCTMVKGSQSPSMGFMQGVKGLNMFSGAPAHDEYPAKTKTMEMHGGESMEFVPVKMVAKPDGSHNYHFMPHVAWVEPGTTVGWMHADIEDISEPRAHSVTSFGGGGYLPRFIPEHASHFDSGYIPGLHGKKSIEHGIDERFNGIISRKLREGGNPLGRGPFMHTFEEEGVYLYYCQNHHQFKMAAAIVVGELWGENGTKAADEAHGWSPAMTKPTKSITKADQFHGHAVREQVHELREMIHSGGKMMGHGGGGH